MHILDIISLVAWPGPARRPLTRPGPFGLFNFRAQPGSVGQWVSKPVQTSSALYSSVPVHIKCR